MKFSFYLFDRSVEIHQGVFRQARLADESTLHEVPLRVNIPGLRVFVDFNRRKRPSWLDFVEPYCDFGEEEIWNTTNVCVLVQEVETDDGPRFFALPVGYGFTALDRSKLETDFGLKVTANLIPTDHLRGLEARTLGAVTQQKAVSINKPSEFWELGADPDREIVRALSGTPGDTDVGRKLRGADALSVHREITVEQIAEYCRELLHHHEADQYKTAFPFIDRYRQVRNRGEIQSLDALLADHVAARARDGLSMFFPIGKENEASAYELRSDRGIRALADVSLQSAYEAMDHFSLAGPDILQSVHISALNDDGRRIHHASIYEHLTFEGYHGGNFYVFSAGRWYRVDPGFLKQIAERLEHTDIVDLSDMLPPLGATETEGAYNVRAGVSPSLCTLDKTTFRQGLGGQSQIEVCDLVSKGGDLICVKKYSGSADLGHLFAQASVSAALFAEHQPYRQFTADQIGTKWAVPFDIEAPVRSSVRFVLAIAIDQTRQLPAGLPFFSRVNLIHHAREISRLGFKVALTRIPWVGVSRGRGPRRRRGGHRG